MSKLLISTQIHENYGDHHDWDGEGECPQYWKAMGGNEYVVNQFNCGESAATEAIINVFFKEYNDDSFQETVIGWEIVDDKYTTEFESCQLEYDGEVIYNPK